MDKEQELDLKVVIFLKASVKLNRRVRHFRECEGYRHIRVGAIRGIQKVFSLQKDKNV